MGKIATIAFLVSFGFSTAVIDMILANQTLSSQTETFMEALRKKGAIDKHGGIKKGAVKKLPQKEAQKFYSQVYRKALQHNLPKAIPLGAGVTTIGWLGVSSIFKRQKKPSRRPWFFPKFK